MGDYKTRKKGDHKFLSLREARRSGRNVSPDPYTLSRVVKSVECAEATVNHLDNGGPLWLECPPL